MVALGDYLFAVNIIFLEMVAWRTKTWHRIDDKDGRGANPVARVRRGGVRPREEESDDQEYEQHGGRC